VKGLIAENPGSQDGFTLVETIVAFVILALVVSTAVEIVEGGGFRQRLEERRVAALLHARSELNEISATNAVHPGVTEGRFDDGYRWRLSEHRIAHATAGQSLVPYTVTIEVTAPRLLKAGVKLESIVLGDAGEGDR
jgi:prepilin-type N-terminal cleavage/methylation domain-containing protein